MTPLKGKCTLFLVLAAVILVFHAVPSPAAATVIKIATVTPEGSTWTKVLRKMAVEVKALTDGEVKFRIYAGGVSGDEMDVLRKMQVNRIHAAGFSGVGLGVILPEIRILEAPLLFKDDQEIDFVKERLFDDFADAFEKKGFVLLGFAEAGFVYFYSRSPMTGKNGLGNVKMWAWKGDPVAETFLKTFGVKTFPLHLTDVNTGLETGMIDAFYSPPLAAVAFQWYSRVQYMLDYPMVNSTGALLIKKRAFDRISPESQEIFKKSARKYCNELVRVSRRDNAEALGVLKEAGIEFESPTEQQIDSFMESARETYRKNMPELYSKALFDRVQEFLNTYRGTR